MKKLLYKRLHFFLHINSFRIWSNQGSICIYIQTHIYTRRWSNTVHDFGIKQQILLNESKNLKSKIYKNTILLRTSQRRTE